MENQQRNARIVVIATIIAVLAAGIIGFPVPGLLTLSRWEVPNSESYRVDQGFLADGGRGNPSLVFLARTYEASVDAVSVTQAGLELTALLAKEPAVRAAWSHWSDPALPGLKSRDGKSALIVASMKGTATEARAALETITPRYRGVFGPLRIEIGGQDEVFRETAALARQDFVRSELIIIPGAFLLLWLVYRRWFPAALTLAVGIGTMLLALAGLRFALMAVEVSTFALNLTLVMSLGLGIDYMLFLVLRYREELGNGKSPSQALDIAWATAGHTVAMSGLSVAIGCSVLWLFPFPFLQSFATTGAIVVASALLLSLVGGRATLVLWGRLTVATGRSGSSRLIGFWRKVVGMVFDRPLLSGGLALALLLLLGSPILGLKLGTPDHRVLPVGSPSRQVEESKNSEYNAELTDALVVKLSMADGSVPSSDKVSEWLQTVSAIPGIFAVNGPWGNSGQYWNLIPESSLDPKRMGELVREVRQSYTGLLVEVGGFPADLEDFRIALLSRLPMALVLLLLATFLLIVWQTGSLLLPLKAIILNMLSLSILFGALVWVFQEGNGAAALGFTPLGALEPSIPILMFCVAFGLSMDYEVLLLSRVQEAYRATGNLRSAVVTAIEGTGPTVTIAATILALTFLVYGLGSVVFLKMLGIGMPLAILVDATIIRLVLVPAFFRVAGPANWWAPRFVKKLSWKGTNGQA